MKNYKIIIGSPVDYEELTAEIVINEEYIAVINQDEGIDKIKIEFFGVPIKTQLYFDEFIEALQAAKKTLLEY